MTIDNNNIVQNERSGDASSKLDFYLFGMEMTPRNYKEFW